MMRRGILAVGAAVLIVAALTTSARAVVVDGGLTDWGITLNGSKQLVFSGGVQNGTNLGTSSSTPNTETIDNFLGNTWKLYYSAEDSSDSAGDSGFVGPNQGGQNYDVEFLGAFIDGTTLTIAISSGQRPDNGLARFGPGDLRIITNNGTFGVEMGGGAGDPARTDGAIDLGDPGTTYNLKSSGFTNTVTVGSDPSDLRTAGSIWLTEDSDWINDPIAPPTPTQLNPGQLVGGQHVGNADAYIYSYASSLGQHAFIELQIDLNLLAQFGLSNIGLLDLEIASLSWGPSCGNDVLDVPVGDGVVPEPASVAVWGGLSVLGLFWVARKRRLAKKQQTA